ncbi:CDP-diacylglycerol--glycerol-3-phosphate 3-phosphatidyltransferase [Holzapfeliella floricola]|uniref:CDP-diacylglycerol--glycerol-3-phosphate 3-phosphatidyltransferase n=1 Tax=Holzapfeliella floricola DSM 23037 = JCM 16512 TaxID=1423744 RepID=A0A0R2DTC9_9LACO|nr:CDP-diacylglycerol--glycerol-3-phosphate 3-phosphatidyltransferase [Holzapfeliella floricola]KRN04183.1 CDP-diacylglycerol--glycerol-3-phosphate 3-phosphatidyltransferase [Holzapfeliella floricola DSM 23037 = JCM 16512]
MNLPNQLTVFRIILIPVFILVLVGGFWTNTITILGTSLPVFQLVAAIIFIGASFTDFLDGYIARKHNLVTNFGKFADPLADKMLVITAFVLLIAINKAPAWVIAIIVCRELAVTGLRLLIVEENGDILSAAILGKIKTFSQMTAIIFLLLNNMPFTIVHLPIGEVLLWICLVFTVWSGIDYFYQNRKIFADSFQK